MVGYQWSWVWTEEGVEVAEGLLLLGGLENA